jgi:5'-nucleotidase
MLDVRKAIEMNFPAGRILPTSICDDIADKELRVAFDFDGVLADDESERIYKETQQLDLFHQHEVDNVDNPMNPGLLMEFFQKLEDKKAKLDPDYRKVLKTSIITDRNAPSHERAINSLKEWEIDVDEMFFLCGIEKKRILEILKPHLFVDDQISHLSMDLKDIPLVHIPFGTANE